VSAALEVRGLRAGYEPGNPIVRDASFAVRSGQVLTLIGPNGAGKSTCVRAVAGLVNVEAGDIQLRGVAIDQLPAHRRVATGLGFGPQSDNVFASLSIAENLALGAPRGADVQGKIRAEALLEALPELSGQRSRLAGTLSGGQRQLLAIARALMANPSVLMLDEPTAGLAPAAVTQVLAQLRRLADEGLAIVLVEQNVRAAFRISDQVVVLVQGTPVMSGTPDELTADPQLTALYLGGGPAR